jgi:serine/threonine protein kinase
MSTGPSTNVKVFSKSINLVSGEVIADRYEVISLIGSGTSAHVYKCRDKQLGTLIVAVKVFPRKLAESSDAIKRIQRELRGSAAVDHQNVARFYDCVLTDSLIGLVMEYVDGSTLEQISENQSLSFERIQQLLIQICKGLGAIHRIGLVHRDLKLQNIVVTKNDELKVTDFGLVRAKSLNCTEAPLNLLNGSWLERWFPEVTVTGDVAGTPLYLSPEYVEHGRFDKQSDIYAVGIIAYHLCTNRFPFDIDSFSDFIASKLEWTPKPPSVANPACPKELSDIVLKALERDRRSRYSTVEELETAIQSIKLGRFAPAIARTEKLTRPTSTVMSQLNRRDGASLVQSYVKEYRKKHSSGSRSFGVGRLVGSQFLSKKFLSPAGHKVEEYYVSIILVLLLFAVMAIAGSITLPQGESLDNSTGTAEISTQVLTKSDNTPPNKGFRFFAPRGGESDVVSNK